METTVTPTQSSMVSGGPQARGTATKIKLESKIVRKRKKGEGGWGRKITLLWQGVACGHRVQPGRASAMDGKKALRAWVAKGCVLIADTKTPGSFNKLATRRTPADLSSTEHLTVLNKT